MATEPIRYDLLVQQALRGMVRDVLIEAAKNGLPGDHHFFVTFDTTAEGVRLSDRLREQYPEEMTVVLQYQFRDLKVTERTFEVVLSFGGVSERLVVPLAAIKGFADPSVQFQLQFEALAFTADDAEEGREESQEGGHDAAEPPKKKSSPRRPAQPTGPAEKSADAAKAATEPEPPPGDKAGAEVVRLDRFRKK
jgi:hypothetical protein